MKSFGIRLAVALVTFVVGVGLTLFWLSRTTPPAVVTTTTVYEETYITLEKCDFGATEQAVETPEAKAVRIAEQFIARNGYTDLPPEMINLAYENIEWEDSIDEMLKSRHNTLERKAYGIRYSGKMNGPGWVVAFRHRKNYGKEFIGVGRAVTMDENFENLLVEHKSFPLANVHKKF
ncbi:MAG: hypothetical protein H7Z38_06750 [Rubrivivax sp.]|nr:hypothetical protein [Pyrinomonadaceae bacterium]